MTAEMRSAIDARNSGVLQKYHHKATAARRSQASDRAPHQYTMIMEDNVT